MRRYHAKIGLEIAVPLYGILITVLILMSIHEPRMLGLMIMLPLLALISYMFTHTYYDINGDQLHIVAAPFYKASIPIHSITSIIETRNIISSPATSLDRLAISGKKFSSVLISPKEKEAFIEHILSVNPNVRIQYRQSKS